MADTTTGEKVEIQEVLACAERINNALEGAPVVTALHALLHLVAYAGHAVECSEEDIIGLLLVHYRHRAANPPTADAVADEGTSVLETVEVKLPGAKP